MGGTWNYRRLRNLSHKHRNISQWKQELDGMRRKPKFPNCRGRFDDCPPPEQDPAQFVKDGKLRIPEKELPSACRICPMYHEWKRV